MARLYTFPEQGWCSNAKKALGKYLSERYNMEYEPPGHNGYAWNSGSYWTIATASGKDQFRYSDLEHLLGVPIDDSDIHVAKKTKKLKEAPEDPIYKFKMGSIVRNISDGYAVIPKGWTARVTGHSPNGQRTYCWGHGNSDERLNAQYDIHTNDLNFVSENAAVWKEQRTDEARAKTFNSPDVIKEGPYIRRKKLDNPREYPLMPNECYDQSLLKELEEFNKQPLHMLDECHGVTYDQIRAAKPKPMRRTKRSKRFLKNLITEYVSGPLLDEVGKYDLGLFPPNKIGNFNGYAIEKSMFNVDMLTNRISELRRRKLFLRRSRR